MNSSDPLSLVLDRITHSEHTEADVAVLRQELDANNRHAALQLGKYNVNIGNGKDIQIGDRIFVDWNDDAIHALIDIVQKQLIRRPTGIPENLPRSGALDFIGREQELEIIHHHLHQPDHVATAAVVGMGGVGKTELVLQYALKYRESFPGGICWLQAKGVNIATQIVQFARSRLQLNPSEELNLLEQVGCCWTQWPPGDVLVIVDNVTNYKEIREFLPPSEPRFKVLMTARSRLGKSVTQLPIDVFTEAEALMLLETLIGQERVSEELDTAKELCSWLENLPLALELVGRYLDRKPDLSLEEMQQRLEKKRLEERSMRTPDTDMTAQLGVSAAFTLSWEILPEDAKQLSCFLSLFAAAPIPWSLVEHCFSDKDADELEELEEIRDEYLVNLHLLKRKGDHTYQLHQLIREFFQEKHACIEKSELLNHQFCQGMETLANRIPESPTRSCIALFSSAIPHIIKAATVLKEHLSDRNLIKPFQGLGRWYEGQGFYDQAEVWYRDCCAEVEKRFGANDPAVAISLSNLANIYRWQGHYAKAKPLYLQALEIRKSLFGDEHIDVADSLNNLALLYSAQGHYSEAESLYLQALSIRKHLLGCEHPDVADSLNNLALLYVTKGLYSEAEPLFTQALETRKALLGSEHPRVATSLNNLAYCYNSQGRYSEAEPLYKEALDLTQRILGEEHPDVATSLNNLAQLYVTLERYLEAEPLVIKALELHQRLLGKEHPNVATSINNLAFLYDVQGCYSKAEPLYLQAIAIRKKVLGEKHPYVGISLNNLAKMYYSQCNYEKAEPLYIQALKILEAELGNEHPVTARVRGNLEQLRTASVI